MQYMQFTAIVLMTILVVKLLLLPRKALMDPVVGKARWLMHSSCYNTNCN